jgi:hypothetical protein
MNRKMLCKLFRASGSMVEEAEDGLLAIDRVKARMSITVRVIVRVKVRVRIKPNPTPDPSTPLNSSFYPPYNLKPDPNPNPNPNKD